MDRDVPAQLGNLALQQDHPPDLSGHTFVFEYCSQTGRPTTDDERAEALDAWRFLDFDQKLAAVRFIPQYIAEAKPSDPKYFFSPRRYLQKRPWTNRPVVIKKPSQAEPRGLKVSEIV